jgi:transcriptional regulator with XRE-family HTH domain
MMNNDNNNIYAMNNTGIIRMVGDFIRQTRINRNMTQEDLAQAAGVNRSTIHYMERGEKGNIETLVRLLRALDQLELFEQFLPVTNISPIAFIKQQVKAPVRASKKR